MSGAVERGRYFRPLCALAGYAIVEQLLLTAVNYVDTAMVGSLGYRASAAVAVNVPVAWLVSGLVMGLSSGYSVQVARAVGAGDASLVRRIIRQAVTATALVGLLLTAAGCCLYSAIPGWLGASEEILADARAYLGVYAASIVFVAATSVFSSIHRCMGNTRLPLRVNVLANLLNIALNAALIYPARTVFFWGRERRIYGAGLGVAGAGLATAVSMLVSALILVGGFYTRRDAYRITFRGGYRPDSAIVRKAARLGASLAAERLVMNIGQLVMTRLVSSLGSMALAANQIAVTAEALCYLPAYGIAHAGTALVGQSIGAGRNRDALRYSRVAVQAAFLLAAATAGLLAAFAVPLCGVFTPSGETAALAAAMLRIVAVSEPFLCAYIVSSGVLRGAGDVRLPLLAGFVAIWAVRIPLALTLVLLAGWGLSGLWAAITVDQVVKGSMCIVRVTRGRHLEPVDIKPPARLLGDLGQQSLEKEVSAPCAQIRKSIHRKNWPS